MTSQLHSSATPIKSSLFQNNQLHLNWSLYAFIELICYKSGTEENPYAICIWHSWYNFHNNSNSITSNQHWLLLNDLKNNWEISFKRMCTNPMDVISQIFNETDHLCDRHMYFSVRYDKVVKGCEGNMKLCLASFL